MRHLSFKLKLKIISLKCKALKKFLPYEGFYPAERTVHLAEQFSSSYGSNTSFNIDQSSIYNFENYEQFSLKPLLTPLFAPGILFNTIKSGVAVDFPIIFEEDKTEFNSDLLDFSTFMNVDDNEIFGSDAKDVNNMMINHTKKTTIGVFRSIYSSRIPFEALVEPETYLSQQKLILQEPHTFSLKDTDLTCEWDGGGDSLYKKMASNFLAEVPDFFNKGENFTTISSLEEENPEFGNAVAGNYYIMRVKMTKSRNKVNTSLGGYNGFPVTPPQDVVFHGADLEGNSNALDFGSAYDRTVRETITMYSRPSAFGPPSRGDGGNYEAREDWHMKLGSTWGYNFPYTPPYYHGEAWCDLIFYASETRKYSLKEILQDVQKFPYYTRYWNPSFHDALRDLTGYTDNSEEPNETVPAANSKYSSYDNSYWKQLIESQSALGEDLNIESRREGAINGSISIFDEWSSRQDMWSTDGDLKWRDWDNHYTYWTDYPGLIPADDLREIAWGLNGPQSPMFVNYNAMQLDSSVNLFGRGTIKTKRSSQNSDGKIEVASSDTVAGKTRWIIQPKFETPILNFNKYTDLDENDCTPPDFAKSQVPRGMWHQYGDLPAKDEGIHLQIEDVPKLWLRGALGIDRASPKVKSLADLVGFSKEKVRLGEVADVKQISEAVVAVPFIEKDGTRQFFSIPREDIDSCIGAVKREVEEGTFVAGGQPKAGDSVYQMVKKMQKYVFPPSMDFVRYKEIDPFAMYVFEFKHNLTKQDLADIWQNLPPDIGTRMEEAEATISHELLAHELLGGGAVVKNGTLDENAEGNGIPSNIQWMIFKAKKRAKTNYFDKVVAKKGTTKDTSSEQLENAQGQTGDDLGITYNWPYDFFSLVELVKIDAEVTFANIENDDKGQKTIKKVEKKSPVERQKVRDAIKNINIARGKGKSKK